MLIYELFESWKLYFQDIVLKIWILKMKYVLTNLNIYEKMEQNAILNRKTVNIKYISLKCYSLSLYLTSENNKTCIKNSEIRNGEYKTSARFKIKKAKFINHLSQKLFIA